MLCDWPDMIALVLIFRHSLENCSLFLINFYLPGYFILQTHFPRLSKLNKMEKSLQYISREEVTSVVISLRCFSYGCCVLVKLELGKCVNVEGRNPENPKKNLLRARTRTNNKLNPHMAPGRNLTRATLVACER